MKICPYCGAVLDDNATHCMYCNRDLPASQPSGNAHNYANQGNGYQPNGSYGYQQPTDAYYVRNNAFDDGPYGKSRGVAALLAILLGGLGVQYFYLGKVGAGLLTILLTLVTCGLWEILTLIQGILMFCMNNADFERKYVTTTSSFPFF